MSGLRFEDAPDGTTRAIREPGQLATFRVSFTLPERVTDLQADAALEAAEKLLHSELRGLLEVCPALAGFTMTVERDDG